MHRSKTIASVRLALTAFTALAAISACTPFSGHVDASQPTKGLPAAATKPGVPSGPAFYTHPEPSFVATDPPATGTVGTTISVFVTYARWNPAASAVELGGYVDRVIESDGSCTVTMTQGSHTVTSSVAAMPDASSTSCGGLSVPRSQLSAGNWDAVISYRSAKHSGSSEPVEVTVP